VEALFFRETQDWELGSLDHFFNDLYAVNITLVRRDHLVNITLVQWDHLVWLPSPSKGSHVGSFYRALLLSTRQPTSFPWKHIWKSGVPPRVAFFVWPATLGKILTVDNLRRRAIINVDWCCM
jgi:hypothetical protein